MGTMVAIIDLMGIMAATMVDILGVTPAVDIRVKEIMAVSIRDSWV